jgi:hypothetical protein
MIGPLEKSLAGSDAPPMSAFLKAVDFVLDEARSPTDGEGPEDEAPRDAAASIQP